MGVVGRFICPLCRPFAHLKYISGDCSYYINSQCQTGDIAARGRGNKFTDYCQLAISDLMKDKQITKKCIRLSYADTGEARMAERLCQPMEVGFFFIFSNLLQRNSLILAEVLLALHTHTHSTYARHSLGWALIIPSEHGNMKHGALKLRKITVPFIEYNIRSLAHKAALKWMR